MHEARLQATSGRELRELGDGALLLDPIDPEPYWNRLVALDWPDDRREFDRRLDAAITVFSTLGRRPHVWSLPSLNHPADLVDRLVAAGFEVMGSDRLMLQADVAPTQDRVAQPNPAGLTVVRLHGLSAVSIRWAPDVAAVLADAFGVNEERRLSIELETLAALENLTVTIVLLLSDGEPVAVAKRSTLAGVSYLSSIGTRLARRRQGLGGLVTAIAAGDAIEAGSDRTYLKVDIDNRDAQRLYERLGFRAVPGQIDDLLIRS